MASILAELGRLYRAGRSGAIATSDMSRLAFVLGLMVKVHADAIFEERLDRLELRDGEREATQSLHTH